MKEMANMRTKVVGSKDFHEILNVREGGRQIGKK